MPELGSKISLISKADIRYEGRLFTVDPQECTIALANGEYDNPRWTPPHHPPPSRRCRQCIAHTEPVSCYEGAYVSETSRPAADSCTGSISIIKFGARQVAFPCLRINIRVIFPCLSRRNLSSNEMKCRLRFSTERTTILDPRSRYPLSSRVILLEMHRFDNYLLPDAKQTGSR